jgi:hypothetical protein
MQLLDSYLEHYCTSHLSVTLVSGKGNTSNKVEVPILFQDEAVATIFQGHYVWDIVTLENETQKLGANNLVTWHHVT